jgi:hypothetical protein
MFLKLLEAAGCEIDVTARPGARRLGPQLADLADAWTASRAGDRPDWTRLRAFVDHLGRFPDEVGWAVRRAPRPSGSAMMDALLAGIADKLADDHRLARPEWTAASRRRLTEPWITPGTPRMLERTRQQTPQQLREHGVLISADSVWRDVVRDEELIRV